VRTQQLLAIMMSMSSRPANLSKAQEPMKEFDDAEKKPPKMVRESSRCCFCISSRGEVGPLPESPKKAPESPKKAPESPKKAPESPKKAPKVKVGRRYAEISASDGIDVANVMESKIFKELIDSLGKKKGFDALSIKIVSTVTKIREVGCDYIVTRAGLPVCETIKRTSDKKAMLDVNTIIRVVEIHEEDEDGRVRARIESPAAGWISLSHHKGTIYAKLHEAVNDTIQIECLVDAKIDGKLVPGIVFVRGSAAAVMVVLHVGGEEKRDYNLLVRQDRVPDSIAAIAEIPCGTFGSDGNLAGGVAKDIFDKIGLEIKKEDLVEVTLATYKDGTPNVFPSCGSENFDTVFVLQERTTEEDFEKLKSILDAQKEGGIQLSLEPMEIVAEKKAHPAVGLYQALITSGVISELSSKDLHWSGKVGEAIGQFLNSFAP
jgi:hypothetical protein